MNSVSALVSVTVTGDAAFDREPTYIGVPVVFSACHFEGKQVLNEKLL